MTQIKGLDTVDDTVPNGYYWFAVREYWGKTRKLTILSRRMLSQSEAQAWADFCESQVVIPNKKYRYHAVLMYDGE